MREKPFVGLKCCGDARVLGVDGAFSFLGQFFPGLTFTRKPVFGGKVPLNFPLEPLDRLFVRLDMQTQFLFDGCMGARFLFNSFFTSFETNALCLTIAGDTGSAGASSLVSQLRASDKVVSVRRR